MRLTRAQHQQRTHDRLLDAGIAYAGLRSGVGEAVERRLPRDKVDDRVLDVQSRHEGLHSRNR